LDVPRLVAGKVKNSDQRYTTSQPYYYFGRQVALAFLIWELTHGQKPNSSIIWCPCVTYTCGWQRTLMTVPVHSDRLLIGNYLTPTIVNKSTCGQAGLKIKCSVVCPRFNLLFHNGWYSQPCIRQSKAQASSNISDKMRWQGLGRQWPDTRRRFSSK
jgi:hypothetical protein